MKSRLFSRWSALLLATVFGPIIPAQAQYVVSNLWSIGTGVRDYVTAGVTERGIAYNPHTHHVLLVSRTTLRVLILDAETGAEVGTMSVAGISGGTFPLSMIGVAEDGAIYGGNLHGTSTGTAPVYRLYRWENETSEPVSVFADNPAGTGLGRWGDHMDVRGSGVNTEVLITAELPTAGPAFAAILRPTDDTMTAFSSTVINLASTPVNDIRAVAFGTNNTFFGKRFGINTLRLFSYDLGAGSASVIASYTVNASTIGLSYETNSALLSAVQTGGAGAAQNLLVYNVAVGGTLPLVATFPFPTPVTANNNAVGSSDFVHSNIVGLATANGIVAARSFFKPEPVIGADPVDTNVVQGGYFTLTADAGGVPPLTYQWRLNGAALPNETNRLLVLTNISLSQQGDYTVAVSNAFGGTISGPGTITVTPTVLSDAMTLLWYLPPLSRPYINTDGTQRGLAYNPANGHVLLISRTGSNAIHVLNGDTGAHLWNMNIDPAIITGGTFIINMIDVADDGSVYAGNLAQDGNFKLYRWADDSEGAVPELYWSGNPAVGVNAGTGLASTDPLARWGDAMDVKPGLNPALVVTSRNTNYVSIIELWEANRPPKVAHLDTLPARSMGLGVAFGADGVSGAYRVWGTSADFALRQIELVETAENILSGTVISTLSGFLPMVNIGVEPASNLLAGISSELPDNVRLIDIISAASDQATIIDTEFFPTDNANGNGTGSIVFGPNRIYALNSNNGIMAWSYSYDRPACVRGTLTITRTSPTEIQLSWTEPGQRLESTTEFSATPTWSSVAGASPVTIQTNGDKMFFRLVCP